MLRRNNRYGEERIFFAKCCCTFTKYCYNYTRFICALFFTNFCVNNKWEIHP